jgi:hypothetical protein
MAVFRAPPAIFSLQGLTMGVSAQPIRPSKAFILQTFAINAFPAPIGVLTVLSSVVENKCAPKVWSDHGCQDTHKPGEGWCTQLLGKILN